MRNYVRHPIQIPLRVNTLKNISQNALETKNVTAYGLCFSSAEKIPPDTIIELSIPSINPNMKMCGRVVWCKKVKNLYDIGVEFTDKENEYRARMMEQVCHIREYQQKSIENTGREMTDSEAAREWIKKFATGFPK